MKKKKTYIGFVLLLMLLLSLGAKNTFACLCQPQSPKQRVKFMKKNADAIFTGTVKSVTLSERFVFEVILSVERSWKGQAIKEQIVYTSGGCRVGFQANQSYLIFAKADENNKLVTEVCWGTRVIKYSEKDIKLLGRPNFINKSFNNVTSRQLPSDVNIWKDLFFDFRILDILAESSNGFSTVQFKAPADVNCWELRKQQL